MKLKSKLRYELSSPLYRNQRGFVEINSALNMIDKIITMLSAHGIQVNTCPDKIKNNLHIFSRSLGVLGGLSLLVRMNKVFTKQNGEVVLNESGENLIAQLAMDIDDLINNEDRRTDK